MIEQSFPSVRPKPIIKQTHGFVGGKWYSPQEHQQATLRGISPEEYVRRNRIVEQLANDFKMQTGDTCYPITASDYEKYGACMVVGITRTYKEIPPTEPWRKGDNPFLIQFKPSTDRNQVHMCTTNYLSKTNPHLEAVKE